MPDDLQPPSPAVIDNIVLAALDEDGAGDDLTTRALIAADQWGTGSFVMKDDGIVCGLPVAAARSRGMEEISDVVEMARARAPHTLRIEVEVTSHAELLDAMVGRPDIVLLDNMPLDEMRRCVESVAGRALVEASGGISLENVRAIAETGVDLISIGRLTHSAPSLDISLEVSGV